MKYLYTLFTFLIVSWGYSQVTLQDFESSPTLGPFGGAAAVYETDPEAGGTRGNVVKATSSAAGNVWQGFTFSIGGGNLDLTNDKTIKLDVYSTTPTEFAVKVQDGLAGAAASVKNTAHTGSGWEQLTIDFSSGNVDNTGAANGVYTVIAVYLNWDAAAGGFGTAQDKTFYIDNLVGVEGEVASNTDVTFTVNTANITVGSNGMYLGGGVFGGSDAHAMTDLGNGTWTVTVPIAQGTTGNYVFFNSPTHGADWGTKEDLAGQACGDAGNYNDRILDAVGADPYTLQHCFGSCETDGTCSTPVDPLLEWTATFTGNDFTAKDGLTYAEADGLGTITNINGASPGENTSPWAHIWATPEGGFDFSTSDRGVTIQVKGPRSVPVKVKFEGNDVELDQTYTDVGNWQTLTYDFSSATTATRSKAIIFFEINTAASADLADDLFYIQQFTFGEAPQDPAITSVDMDFEDAADASNWTPSDVGMSVSHVTTGGNTGGALHFGFNEGGDRRLSYTYSNFDYTGATTARITFDMLQSSTTLAGTAIHFRHSTTGTEDGDATFYGAIQGQGINASTWTSFEYDETVTGNSDLIHLSFQIAQGAFPEAEGEFLLDNVAVTLLDANGDTLSVYEIETPQFITYPNPLQNTLNIKGTTDVENVNIYDLMGRNVLNATPNNSEFSLDVSQLNKGVYMVQLKAGDKETTLKIVK
ncbi:MAG: T9SS type A sorting domain-containing protein [Flavobacteriaceae bacterium]